MIASRVFRVPAFPMACLSVFVLMISCPAPARALCDCTQTGVTGVNQIECEALVALYNSANGPGWWDSFKWDTTSAVNTWYGVSASGMSVIDIDLYNNNLIGPIPSELGNLSNLTVLWLESNQLSGPIPPGLGNLSNLTRLWLESNQLSGPIPPELGNLSNLTSLYLWDNQLSGPIPPELGNLSNLTSLALYSNQLSGPIPPEMGNLSNLTSLYLWDNQLSGPIPPELGNLSNVTSLALYSNQLSGPIPPELGNLSNLNVLRLYSNQLIGPIPSELGNLSNVTSLALYSNQLSGPIPPELGNLSNLTRLYLGSNQLSGPIPPELGNLSNLGALMLEFNQLSGDIPNQITNLTGLTNLSLGYNLLASSELVVLAFLDSKDPGWADTQTVPPGSVGVADITPTSVRVTWTPITYTRDGGYYQIGYSETPGGLYTSAGITADKTATDFTVTGLTSGTTYYFVVETFTPAHGDQQNALTSDWSAATSATTLLVCDAVATFADPGTVSPGTVVLGETVSFVNESTGDAVTGGTAAWSWDFGDGGASSLMNPIHVFETLTPIDPLTVTLTALGTTCESEAYRAVLVICGVSEVAFYVEPRIALVEENISFTEELTVNSIPGMTVTREWDFGDGDTSTDESPTHAYSTEGEKNVTLTVTAAGVGYSCQESYSDTVSIGPPCDAIAVLHGTTRDGAVFLDTTGSNSPGAPLLFDYGDGQSGTDDTHAYDDNGTYTITMTAMGTQPDCSAADSGTFIVEPPSDVCNAAATFTFTTDELTAAFDAAGSSSPNGPLSFDYGDGDSGVDLSHIYAAAGVYQVTMTASGEDHSGECKRTYSRIVTLPSGSTGNTAPVIIGHFELSAAEGGGDRHRIGRSDRRRSRRCLSDRIHTDDS